MTLYAVTFGDVTSESEQARLLERFQLATQAQQSIETWATGARMLSLTKTLHENGWFGFLAEPRSVSELADFSGLPPARVADIVAVATAYEVVESEADRIRLTPAFEALASGEAPMFLDDILDYSMLSVGHARAVAVEPEPLQLTEDELLAFARFGGGRSTAVTQAVYDRYFLSHLPELPELIRTERWLDVGCGIAGASVTFAAMFPELHGTGIELVPAVAAEAAQRAAELGVSDRLEIRCLDAQDLDEPAAYGVAFWAQPFFPEHTRAGTLAAIRRSLRPGGVLMMQEIAPSSEPSATLRQLVAYGRGMPIRRTAEELVTEATAAGFELLRTASTEQGRYVLVQSPQQDS